MHRRRVFFLLVSVITLSLAVPSSRAAEEFYIPQEPPGAQYYIDCRMDPDHQGLRISETIFLKNTTERPISHLAFNRSLIGGYHLRLRINGTPMALSELAPEDQGPPLIVKLPDPLLPGAEAEIFVNSMEKSDIDSALTEENPLRESNWHPKLWWGERYHGHDDYNVRLYFPPEFVAATSGRYDPSSSSYIATGVRSFGLVIGRDLGVLTDMAGDVSVRALYTDSGKACAESLVATAVDIIGFYRERFGFYPHATLTIIPGLDNPVGGSPVATGIVEIHGQERMVEQPEAYWQWITAHEIGHQYWWEYVLEKDPQDMGWLMIGLGLYADREYMRKCDLSYCWHRDIMNDYLKAAIKGHDTRMDATTADMYNRDYSYRNAVIRGKGFCVISALANLLGQETFDRIYLRCLDDFAGRRMGTADFEQVCEDESGQDLAWFFDQWVRSSKYLSCEITSQNSTPATDGYVTEIRVENRGTLKMPVEVEARFEDGSSQLKRTSRFREINVLRFESASPLADVRLDPKGELSMITPPVPTDAEKKTAP